MNLVTINLGLLDTSGHPVNVHTACLALQSYGFTVYASRVFTSSYEGNPEPVLVAVAEYRGSDLEASLLALVTNLRQECIAYVCNGIGELIPPLYTFDPSKFVNLSGKTS